MLKEIENCVAFFVKFSNKFFLKATKRGAGDFMTHLSQRHPKSYNWHIVFDRIG